METYFADIRPIRSLFRRFRTLPLVGRICEIRTSTEVQNLRDLWQTWICVICERPFQPYRLQDFELSGLQDFSVQSSLAKKNLCQAVKSVELFLMAYAYDQTSNPWVNHEKIYESPNIIPEKAQNLYKTRQKTRKVALFWKIIAEKFGGMEKL